MSRRYDLIRELEEAAQQTRHERETFGFSHSDVGIVREAAKRILAEGNPYVADNFYRNLNDIADRIESLLPATASGETTEP